MKGKKKTKYFPYNVTFKNYAKDYKTGRPAHPHGLLKEDAEAYVTDHNRMKGGKWVVHTQKEHDDMVESWRLSWKENELKPTETEFEDALRVVLKGLAAICYRKSETD